MRTKRKKLSPIPFSLKSRLTINQARGWLGKGSSSNSTLLIPPHLVEYVRMRRREFGSMPNYFRYLVMVYGMNLDWYEAEPHHIFCKKKYQEVTKNYQRFDFCPDAIMWEELRNLSYIYGPSMCWMFVYLVRLEKMRWNQAGCPENFREEPPLRFTDSDFQRNSEKRNAKILQEFSEVLQKEGPRTISVRIVDNKHRWLTRTGQIRV